MKTLTAVLAVLAISAVASAAPLEGEMVFQGNNGTGDVYFFEVTNNMTEDVQSYGTNSTDNVEFTGDFLNAVGVGFVLNSSTTNFGLSDTFFVGNGDGLNKAETSTSLSADVYGTLGIVATPAGSTATLAQLVVSPGSDVPTFNEIPAYNPSGEVIGTVVPEPATLALLGLGGLAVIRRRRAA
jgi:opacity protein-like surface antigen